MIAQIAAEENVIQMINGAALPHLHKFCVAVKQDPLTLSPAIKDLASRLIQIPALYSVIQHEINSGRLSGETIGTATWLYKCSATALMALKQYDAPSIEIQPGSEDNPERWQSVSIIGPIRPWVIVNPFIRRQDATMDYPRSDDVPSIPIYNTKT